MKKINPFNTDFLFTTPSYLTGAATAFNLAGDFYDYNKSDTDHDADCTAIMNDFDMIGADLHEAMQKIMNQ